MISKYEFDEAQKTIDKYNKQQKESPKPEKKILSKDTFKDFDVVIQKCDEFITNVHDNGYSNSDNDLEEIGMYVLVTLYGGNIEKWLKSKEI